MNYVSEDHSFVVRKISGEITLDGRLDEQSWITASQLNNFSQYAPSNEVRAIGQTEVYMQYDDNNLYIAMRCYAESDKFNAATLKRDYGFMNNDNMTLIFDTYNDGTNAFVFGINPYGATREALISEGGRNQGAFDDSWDNKWRGEAKRNEDNWTAEIIIPFKAIRFKAGTTKWRFNTYRNDAQSNEISSWMNIPRNRILMDLTYMSEMRFEEPLKSAGSNIVLIPYVAASAIRDFEDVDETEPNYGSGIGGDAKIALSPSMNLDLTINPDFSQVEVDRQVTNLDRFEIFFPERRQFFLENADLFGGFGFGRVNPFFSRRIGVAVDTTTDDNIQNTIYAGARLNGKINEKLRVGLLSMQTAAQQQNDLPSFNYTVLAAEQRMFSKSNIGFIFVNKQAFDAENFEGTVDSYDRIAGLEYRLASADNRWTGKAGLMKALTPNADDHKFAHVLNLNYTVRKYSLEYVHSFVGEGFDAEVGFVPRRDIFRASPEGRLNFYPKGDLFSQISVGVDTRFIYKVGREENEYINDFSLVETGYELFSRFDFANNYNFSVSLHNEDIFLLDDFDPTGIQEDDIFLPGGEDYNFTFMRLNFNSDRRNRFFYRINTNVGQFFSGQRFGLNGQIRYGIQPYVSLSTDFSYNRIKFDAPFETANLWLVGPRVDVTFTKKLFLTSFFQYNNQQENFNINTRFQWRFAPVSDFFLVYTDNYLTDNFSQFSKRNRALVAKLTYWLGF